ncbi:tRNA (adenine-N(1)-)-methyltransferase catalytic subunit trm61 [Diaporthe australafricana]|uniref:tRNA (Adenine-N(1)-)-methyltransferase catalytic subunit trm61 n=1 Tax=Diaporthe australafricana TaxID=127596 RepID=A0ABR3WI42_9PEZI
MATLPHGWAADYDGARWFYVYGATGQSQFQFPRPGDEFPDFGGAVATLLPAVELMPEEKLESERQVRRLVNASGLGKDSSELAGNDMEELVDGKKGLRGHVGTVHHAGDGGGHGTLCFESFAAAGPRGRQAVSGKHERRGIVDQGGCRVDDGSPVSALTSSTDAAQESTGEPTSVPLLIASEHARKDVPPDLAVPSTAATLTVMGEPVLTVVETTVAAPSVQLRGEDQPAAVARSPLAELPALDRRSIDFIRIPLGASPVGDVPELYSDSTALCEDGINPPPVELPGSEGGWIAHAMVPNLVVQSLFELPACEGSCSSPETANSTAGLGANPYSQMTMVENHGATANAGLGETPGAKGRGHDRAGLPSQASRISPKNPLDEAMLRGIVNSASGQEAPVKKADNPAYVSQTVQRNLSHFPSILRPGPRNPGRPVKPDTVSNTAHAVPARLHKPPEHQGKRQNEADAPYQGISVRMPAMPLMLHPPDAPNTAMTPSPGTPDCHGIGATRHNRLPSSVNFVIPISHIAAPAAAAAVTRSGLPGLHHDDAWAQWPDDKKTASWNSDPSPKSVPPQPPLGVTRHT